MKIKKCRKNGKLKKLQSILFGTMLLGLTSILTGCTKEQDKINIEVEETISLSNDAGFIIDGEEKIPFYVSWYNKENDSAYKYDHMDIEGRFLSFKAGKAYSLNDKNFIGDVYKCDDVAFYPTGRNTFITDKMGRILYAPEQVAFFKDCDSNLSFDYSMITSFKDRDYYLLKQLFLRQFPFWNRNLYKYEVENLITGERKNIIGYRLSDSLLFNYETYTVENYAGYEIKYSSLDYNKTMDHNILTYTEILDVIAHEKASDRARG